MKTIILFLISLVCIASTQVRAQIITSTNQKPESTQEYYPTFTWGESGYNEFDYEVNPDNKYGLIHQSGEKIFDNEFDYIVCLEKDNQLYILFKADTFGIYSTLDSSYSGCKYTNIRKKSFVYEFNFQGKTCFIYDQKERWEVVIPPFLETELISNYALSVLTEKGYQLILYYRDPETVIELNSKRPIEYDYTFGFHNKLRGDSVRLYILESGKFKWTGDFSRNVQQYDSLLIDHNLNDLSVYNYKTGELISEIKTSSDYISFDERTLLVSTETELNKKTMERSLYNPFSGELILSIELPLTSSMLRLEPEVYSPRDLDRRYFVYYTRARNNFLKTYIIGEITGYEYTHYKNPRISTKPYHSTYSKRRFPLFWTTN